MRLQLAIEWAKMKRRTEWLEPLDAPNQRQPAEGVGQMADGQRYSIFTREIKRGEIVNAGAAL